MYFFKQIKKFKKFFKILFFIFILFCNFNLFQKYKIFFINIYSIYQTKKLENYLNFLNNDQSKDIKSFKISNFPKISIISPVYNRERYISRFIRSIQYQNFYNFEIIFVNDCSVDNSVKIIENFRKKDKRIKLINFKKNRGTFITRNIGVLFSKGKYIILPDPDDIITKNILSICYKQCEKYKYEIIKFILYYGNKKIFKNINILNEEKPIYQPELSTNIFYIDNELIRTDFSLCNKFMKKEVYIKTINFINNFYLNLYIITFEDQILNFMLYQTAKSFYYLKVVGYYYIKSSISITNNLKKISELNNKFLFIYLKFLFEYSKNKKYDKDMCNLLITSLTHNLNNLQFSSLDINNYNFYINIIEMYINNDFITYDNKNILNNLKIQLKKIFK